jgi:phosphoglycolate phosphatase-like HAD superfamily hydrolase
MPLKAIFFDIDGTLVDSNEFHVMAWDEAFHEFGLITTKDQLRSQIGKGADQLIPFLFPQVSEADDQEGIAKRHGDIFRSRYLGQVKPFPNATDLLEMVHTKGKRVILASSADRAEIDYYADLLKAQSFIEGSVGKDDVANSKPSGDIFAAALAMVFPMAVSETLAIGDTPYDVESALRSDIRTIALRSGGWSDEALARAKASFVYASVKELFDQFNSSPLAE